MLKIADPGARAKAQSAYAKARSDWESIRRRLEPLQYEERRAYERMNEAGAEIMRLFVGAKL